MFTNDNAKKYYSTDTMRYLHNESKTNYIFEIFQCICFKLLLTIFPTKFIEINVL